MRKKYRKRGRLNVKRFTAFLICTIILPVSAIALSGIVKASNIGFKHAALAHVVTDRPAAKSGSGRNPVQADISGLPGNADQAVISQPSGEEAVSNTPPPSQAGNGAEGSTSSPLPPNDGSEDSASPSPSNGGAAGSALPPSPSGSIFSGALFLGDSITEGLDIYDFVEGAAVVAGKGLTASKALGLINSIYDEKPVRVFILLGLNDLLTGIDAEGYEENCISLVKLIKQGLPNAEVYLQSIFPVSSSEEAERPLLANSRIREFNEALAAAAEKSGALYIDVAHIFMDAIGCMDDKYTSDGIHLKYEYYRLWLDFLRSGVNTVTK